MPVKYPHMLPQETRIWDRYLDQFGVPEGRISYDVHLGDGLSPDPDWPEWMIRMVKVLSTHRADVIVERQDEVIIVEVKSVAGMGALGQMLGYEALWVKERGTSRGVRLMCVCETAEADVEVAYDFYGIELVELGEVEIKMPE